MSDSIKDLEIKKEREWLSTLTHPIIQNGSLNRNQTMSLFRLAGMALDEIERLQAKLNRAIPLIGPVRCSICKICPKNERSDSGSGISEAECKRRITAFVVNNIQPGEAP